jgi:hypothetical protein
MPSIIANLTPASGRQDHTTSPCARRHSSRDITRPSLPAPNVSDDGQRPSCGHGIAGNEPVICPRDQQQSVRQSNTTGKSAICRQEEFGEAARVLSLVVKLGLSDVYHRGPLHRSGLRFTSIPSVPAAPASREKAALDDVRRIIQALLRHSASRVAAAQKWRGSAATESFGSSTISALALEPIVEKCKVSIASQQA